MTRVSIVIPCFDDGLHLSQSVRSALDQTYDDVEVLVVDDGSSDAATLRELRSLPPGVQVLRQSNAGVSTARNTAIAAASGDYILPLDADDLLDVGYAAAAAGILDRKPEVGVVGCATRLFGTEDTVVRPPAPHPVDWLLANRLPVSSVFRRADWVDCGGFDEDLVWGEDWHFWVKIIARGRQVAVLPNVGLHYRRRPGQTTADVPWSRQERAWARVLQDGLPIMLAHPVESSLAIAQRLTLLQAMRERPSERLRSRILTTLRHGRRDHL